MEVLCLLLLLTVEQLVFTNPNLSSAADAIRPPNLLTDGETLVSEGGSFELGFFSPGSSKLRYVGIWYNNIPLRTFVWVANRESPIQDNRGSLRINSTSGRLIILGGNHSLIWSSNSSREIENPVAQLLDSGNFVLRDGNEESPESFLWQSFDYPCDTLLPGMKFGWDLTNGSHLRRLQSWKSSDDPSPGEITFTMEPQNSYPEARMMRGSSMYYRTGPWNGIHYSGALELRPNPLYHFEFHANEKEVYYIYQLSNKSVISRLVMNGTTSSGQRYIWVEETQTWRVYLNLPRDNCDTYGMCGAYGLCVISESPPCQCLKGFEPKSPQKWRTMEWSEGCVRSKPLNCSNEAGFAKFDMVKLPDTTHTWVNRSMTLEECRIKCLANCSCSAYSNYDVRAGGSGCAIWFGDLIDMRQLPIGEQQLYIRMQASDLGDGISSKMKAIMISLPAVAIVSAMLIACYYIRKRRMDIKDSTTGEEDSSQQPGDLELPVFDLATVVDATDSFSNSKKLGEGGFGPVFKGILPDGREIAVKRPSLSSGQGLKEFKNEVTLIAKLQHRNLVKLLGCCIEREHMMLIYEYMPNRSLDSFIFDQTKAKVLDWSKRFGIICGIARGLLYLHQDSRLRIIHRDLKASNVLLDNEMNPKISDFGLARSFGGDLESLAKTKKVVGTYGYMAPEYAIDGIFSVKSDVFSFGVLLLEIITGKRNRGFYHRTHGLNLVGHAWKLWKADQSLELINESYWETSTVSEILRCIHIGLLCVQQKPEDRPNMYTVILMLSSEIPLADPKQPGFFVDRNPLEEEESSSSKNRSISANEVSLSLLEAR